MTSVQKARLRKTTLFFQDRPTFENLLRKDIQSFITYCNNKKQKPALRLNGVSDLPIEKLFDWTLKDFPIVQYYDYTKSPVRMKYFLAGKLPSNYYLTFSRSETNEKECKEILKLGGNVAIVFKGKLPKTYWGYKVVPGDETDLRFLDKTQVIIGLTAKGKAKKDLTGFVINT